MAGAAAPADQATAEAAVRKFSFWGSSAGAPAVSGQSSGAPRGVRPGVGFGLPGGLAGCRVSRGLCAVELVFGCSGASGATSLFELPPAMITAPQSRSGGLARDSSEVRFWSTVATEALDRSAECKQLCERTQAPTTPREPPGARRHASRARGAAAKWVDQRRHAHMRSTSRGPRPCGARVYMAARRATRCCARSGGRSRHRLQYLKSRRPSRCRCRPIYMRDSSRTTTSERNRDRLLGGRAISTRATPWCHRVACAGPRTGTAAGARRYW